MKNWQFGVMMSAVWIAPVHPDGFNVFASIVFILLSAFSFSKD